MRCVGSDGVLVPLNFADESRIPSARWQIALLKSSLQVVVCRGEYDSFRVCPRISSTVRVPKSA